MDVTEYAAYTVNQQGVVPYTKDYVGGVRLLQDSQFFPFKQDSPFGSTITQVFDEFIQKTGIGLDAETLRGDFLEEYPSTQRALDLYGALKNNFTPKGAGEKATIVDFLNNQLDEYIETNDTDQDQALTLVETDMDADIFEATDADNDLRITADEMKNNFYENYEELDNVMNYFRSNSGSLVDTYG
ncbi:MAG: hypothetical protein GY757_40170 [bacterium]|nr:hypothetical protein [bacterium]